MPKSVPSAHQLEQRSRAKLKLLLEGWAISDLGFDVGLDFVAQLTVSKQNVPSTKMGDDSRDVIARTCYIQLKAKTSFAQETVVGVQFNKDFTESYWQNRIPVAVVFYEDESDSFYYTFLQDYYWDELFESRPGWRTQDQVTISVNRESTIQSRDSFGEKIDRCVERISKRECKRRAIDSEIGSSDRFPDPVAGHEHTVDRIKRLLSDAEGRHVLQKVKCIIENSRLMTEDTYIKRSCALLPSIRTLLVLCPCYGLRGLFGL